jgi:hypothetical protein
LRAIYRLAQGPGHTVAPLGRGAALAALVACSPYVNRDPVAAGDVLEGLARLVDSVPVQQLTFAPRPGVRAALTS